MQRLHGLRFITAGSPPSTRRATAAAVPATPRAARIAARRIPVPPESQGGSATARGRGRASRSLPNSPGGPADHIAPMPAAQQAVAPVAVIAAMAGAPLVAASTARVGKMGAAVTPLTNAEVKDSAKAATFVNQVQGTIGGVLRASDGIKALAEGNADDCSTAATYLVRCINAGNVKTLREAITLKKYLNRGDLI